MRYQIFISLLVLVLTTSFTLDLPIVERKKVDETVKEILSCNKKKVLALSKIVKSNKISIQHISKIDEPPGIIRGLLVHGNDSLIIIVKLSKKFIAPYEIKQLDSDEIKDINIREIIVIKNAVVYWKLGFIIFRKNYYENGEPIYINFL